jgi:hypothetical protein
LPAEKRAIEEEGYGGFEFGLALSREKIIMRSIKDEA